MGFNEFTPDIFSASTEEQKIDIQRHYDALKNQSYTDIKNLLDNTDYEK
jgi:hypothetical protein